MSIKSHVAELESHRAAGVPLPVQLAKWTADIDDDLHGKLVAVGLVDPRVKPENHGKQSLTVMTGEFVATLADLKPSAITPIQQTIKKLKLHFGADCAIGSISAGMADGFVRYLRGGSASATAARRITHCKTMFRWAVRMGRLPSNPFEGIKAGAQTNPLRQVYVTRQTIQAVIDAAPSDEWKALIALGRFAGLRIPSEALAMRWRDITWEPGRILVHSPKTEGCGKATRLIPLFAEVRPYLATLFDVAEPGAEFVFPVLRQTMKASGAGNWRGVNLRTRLMHFIHTAGIEPWPKLWNNLRSSLATDLTERVPAQTAAAWLGHSVVVAGQHYWQVRPEHFDSVCEHSDASILEAGQKLGQNPGHSTAISSHPEFAGISPETKKPLKNRGFDKLRRFEKSPEKSQGCPRVGSNH
jgi:integrase